jgi:hypothetical protein
MDINAIRDYLHKVPFQPFTMRLADGRQFPIAHRDFVAVSPRTVVVIDQQTEAATVLEPLLIISLELSGGQQVANQNGG